MEVRSGGGYSTIEWSTDGIRIGRRLVHFGDILCIEDTTTFDTGLYEVDLAPSFGQSAPDTVEFIVIQPGTSLPMCGYAMGSGVSRNIIWSSPLGPIFPVYLAPCNN